MSISGLKDLLDDGVLISTDAQLRLADVIGDGTPYDGRFDVDLEAQQISFTGSERLEARVHYLGSAAPGPGSWMWAWNNINGFPDPVLARAIAVRDFGQQYGVKELTTAELPLTDQPRSTAGRFATVSSLINGRLPYYTAEVGGGTVAAFLVEHPDFVLQPLDSPRLATVLQTALMDGQISDWPRALRQYAAFRGLTCTVRDGGLLLAGPSIDPVQIDLDQQGRVARLSATMTGRSQPGS